MDRSNSLIKNLVHNTKLDEVKKSDLLHTISSKNKKAREIEFDDYIFLSPLEIDLLFPKEEKPQENEKAKSLQLRTCASLDNHFNKVLFDLEKTRGTTLVEEETAKSIDVRIRLANPKLSSLTNNIYSAYELKLFNKIEAKVPFYFDTFHECEKEYYENYERNKGINKSMFFLNAPKIFKEFKKIEENYEVLLEKHNVRVLDSLAQCIFQKEKKEED